MIKTASTWQRTVLIVAVCGLGLFIGTTWQTVVANPARVAATTPTAVAVVDLNRVLEGLAEYEEMVQRLGGQIESSERGIQELTARIRQVEMELEAIKDRNSQAFVDKSLDRMLLQHNREQSLKIANQRLDLLRGEAMRTIYRKITVATERLGEMEGWDLILLDDRSLVQLADEGGLITGSRMNDFVINRRTLYAGARADITDQLITMMNNDFKAARR